MLLKAIFAVSVLALSSIGASAQNLSNTDGPSEIPPNSFSGKQYVDSQGCVYVRAGFDGNVVWVPRVSRSRQLLCGFAPTFADAAPVLAEPELVQTVVVAPPVQPIFRSSVNTVVVAIPVTSDPNTTLLPSGFREAWVDGRLNPKRGPQTVAGDIQMAAIWTETLPRKSVNKKTTLENVITSTVTVSSKTPDATVILPSFVQLGTYGVPGNARAVVAWLQGNGLPNAVSKSTMGGKDVQTIVAGPFHSQTELQQMLNLAHGAGYSDAFVRR